MNTGLRLLDLPALVRTSDLDQAAWSHRRGPLGWVMRRRYLLTMRLLDDRHGSLLEVGYGSGIFMPTLASTTESLFGVDIHRCGAAVDERLQEAGVRAALVTASMESLPFEDGSFDAVVALSSLEFIDDLDAACREVVRILRPNGSAVVVTPARSAVLDAGLRLLTGERAEDTFHGRREHVIPTLERWFVVERRLTFPVRPFPVYTALRCRPRQARAVGGAAA